MSAFETAVVVGMAAWILVAVGLLVSFIRLELLLRRLRDPLIRTAETLAHARVRLDPVLRNAERASEDVRYIVGSLRADVGEVGDTLRGMSRSTDRMVAMVEERVAEVHALLEVVQEEAEETFYSTASLLRGFRGGRSRRREGRRRRVGGDGG